MLTISIMLLMHYRNKKICILNQQCPKKTINSKDTSIQWSMTDVLKSDAQAEYQQKLAEVEKICSNCE